MTEKIGTVKNPLTIIAIFAGIAEVCGTTVLPFVSSENQLTFIYFLIAFPTILILLFFSTLNFNNKALYAPSDFSNEENYIKIFKYDISKQEQVEVNVSKDDVIKMLNNNMSELKEYSHNRISNIEQTIRELATKENIDEAENFQNTYETTISISNFSNSNNLKNIFDKKGYKTEIYFSPDNIRSQAVVDNYKQHQCIWLGERVPFQRATEIISIAKRFYPHLKYIDISDTFAPDEIHDQIYIGGATSTAIENNLKPLKEEDFEKLYRVKSTNELHEMIQEFKSII